MRIIEEKNLAYLEIQNGTYAEQLLNHFEDLFDLSKCLLLQLHAELRVPQLSVHGATMYYH